MKERMKMKTMMIYVDSIYRMFFLKKKFISMGEFSSFHVFYHSTR